MTSHRVPAVVSIIALLVLAAACSGTAEEVTPAATATPATTVISTPTAAPTPAITPTPAVPADWKTYSDPEGLFTVRYPPGWFLLDNSVSSVDPNAADKGSYAESVHVEFSVRRDDGYGCGVLAFDLASGKVAPQPGATQSSLGGISAWKIVREPGDPLLNDPYSRIEAISVIHNGYCINIAGYFRQQHPDVTLFPAIIATFQFIS